jgi:hypothetical protein
MLRTALLILCGVMLPLAATTPAAEPEPSAPVSTETTLKVTVQYTGPGQVSQTNRIWVWLFDREPHTSADVPPIAQQSLTVNGGVASFTAIAPRQVWVTVIYDEKGGYAADGPPPSGSPASAHLVNNQPAPVAPGPNAAIQITFNDQYRLP